MSRLLYAGFARLRKDPLFWAGMVLMFLLTVFLVVLTANSTGMNLDEILFVFLQVIGFMCAIFCSYFTGREYHDGTIRNKLVAGYTRTEVYLSNLIINVTASLCLCVLVLVTETLLGLILIGGIHTSAGKLLGALFGSFLVVIAFCSIFTLIAMLDQRKSASDLISILLACVLLISAFYLMDQPIYEIEDYDKYYGDDETYYKAVSGARELPYYVRHRQVYEFLYDFLPSGQSIQYMLLDTKRPIRLPLYSMGIILVTTSFGVFVFRKKNIR